MTSVNEPNQPRVTQQPVDSKTKTQKTKSSIVNLVNSIMSVLPQNIEFAKEINKLADDLYKYAEEHDGAIGKAEFTNLLRKIKPENIVSLILRYDQISDDETILDMMIDEVTQYNKTDVKEALVGDGNGKNRLRGVFTVLLDRAKEVGMDGGTIDSYRSQFESELNKQLNKSISAFRNSSELDSLMYSVVESIAKHEAENRTDPVRKGDYRDTMNAARAYSYQTKAYNMFCNNYNKALADFNAQMQYDGIAEDFADLLGRIWGDNYADAVREDLWAVKHQVDRLHAALNDDKIDFRAEFYDIFDTTFDPIKIQAYMDSERTYIAAQAAKSNLDNFKDQFRLLLNGGELREEYTTRTYATATTYSVTPVYVSKTKAEVYQREFNRVAELFDSVVKNDQTGQFASFGITDGKSYVNKAIEAAGGSGKSVSEKYTILQNIVKSIKKGLNGELTSICGGRTFSQVRSQYNRDFKRAFGTSKATQIQKRVTDYNISQQRGGGVVKGVATAAAAVAIGFLTHGAGMSAFTGTLVTAGGAAAASATIEITDRYTSKAALDALKKDGVLAFLKKGAEVTDWKNVAKTALVTGVMCVAFAGQSYAITNLTVKAATAAGLSAEAAGYTAAGVSTAGMIGTGLGIEYVLTGEITVEGATFTVVMALIAGTMQVIQVHKAAQVSKAQAQTKAEQFASEVQNARQTLGIGDDVELTPELLKNARNAAIKLAHPDLVGEASTNLAAQINGAYRFLNANMANINAGINASAAAPAGHSASGQQTHVATAQDGAIVPSSHYQAATPDVIVEPAEVWFPNQSATTQGGAVAQASNNGRPTTVHLPAGQGVVANESIDVETSLPSSASALVKNARASVVTTETTTDNGVTTTYGKNADGNLVSTQIKNHLVETNTYMDGVESVQQIFINGKLAGSSIAADDGTEYYTGSEGNVIPQEEFNQNIHAAMEATEPQTPQGTLLTPPVGEAQPPQGTLLTLPTEEVSAPQGTLLTPPVGEPQPPQGTLLTPPVEEVSAPQGTLLTPPVGEPQPPQGTLLTPPTEEVSAPQGTLLTPPAAEAQPPQGTMLTPPASESTPVTPLGAREDYVPIIPLDSNDSYTQITETYQKVAEENINKLIEEYRHVQGKEPIRQSILEDIIENTTGMDIVDVMNATENGGMILVPVAEEVPVAEVVPLNPQLQVTAVAASEAGPVADPSAVTGEAAPAQTGGKPYVKPEMTMLEAMPSDNVLTSSPVSSNDFLSTTNRVLHPRNHARAQQLQEKGLEVTFDPNTKTARVLVDLSGFENTEYLPTEPRTISQYVGREYGPNNSYKQHSIYRYVGTENGKAVFEINGFDATSAMQNALDIANGKVILDSYDSTREPMQSFETSVRQQIAQGKMNAHEDFIRSFPDMYRDEATVLMELPANSDISKPYSPVYERNMPSGLSKAQQVKVDVLAKYGVTLDFDITGEYQNHDFTTELRFTKDGETTVVKQHVEQYKDGSYSSGLDKALDSVIADVINGRPISLEPKPVTIVGIKSVDGDRAGWHTIKTYSDGTVRTIKDSTGKVVHQKCPDGREVSLDNYGNNAIVKFPDGTTMVFDANSHTLTEIIQKSATPEGRTQLTPGSEAEITPEARQLANEYVKTVLNVDGLTTSVGSHRGSINEFLYLNRVGITIARVNVDTKTGNIEISNIKDQSIVKTIPKGTKGVSVVIDDTGKVVSIKINTNSKQPTPPDGPGGKPTTDTVNLSDVADVDAIDAEITQLNSGILRAKAMGNAALERQFKTQKALAQDMKALLSTLPESAELNAQTVDIYKDFINRLDNAIRQSSLEVSRARAIKDDAIIDILRNHDAALKGLKTTVEQKIVIMEQELANPSHDIEYVPREDFRVQETGPNEPQPPQGTMLTPPASESTPVTPLGAREDYVPIIPLDSNDSYATITETYQKVAEENINKLIEEYRHVQGKEPIRQSILEDIIENTTGMDIVDVMNATENGGMILVPVAEEVPVAEVVPLNPQPQVTAVAASEAGPVADPSAVTGDIAPVSAGGTTTIQVPAGTIQLDVQTQQAINDGLIRTEYIEDVENALANSNVQNLVRNTMLRAKTQAELQYFADKFKNSDSVADRYTALKAEAYKDQLPLKPSEETLGMATGQSILPEGAAAAKVQQPTTGLPEEFVEVKNEIARLESELESLTAPTKEEVTNIERQITELRGKAKSKIAELQKELKAYGAGTDRYDQIHMDRIQSQIKALREIAPLDRTNLEEVLQASPDEVFQPVKADNIKGQGISFKPYVPEDPEALAKVTYKAVPLYTKARTVEEMIRIAARDGVKIEMVQDANGNYYPGVKSVWSEGAYFKLDRDSYVVQYGEIPADDPYVDQAWAQQNKYTNAEGKEVIMDCAIVAADKSTVADIMPHSYVKANGAQLSASDKHNWGGFQAHKDPNGIVNAVAYDEPQELQTLEGKITTDVTMGDVEGNVYNKYNDLKKQIVKGKLVANPDDPNSQKFIDLVKAGKDDEAIALLREITKGQTPSPNGGQSIPAAPVHAEQTPQVAQSPAQTGGKPYVKPEMTMPEAMPSDNVLAASPRNNITISLGDDEAVVSTTGVAGLWNRITSDTYAYSKTRAELTQKLADSGITEVSLGEGKSLVVKVKLTPEQAEKLAGLPKTDVDGYYRKGSSKDEMSWPGYTFDGIDSNGNAVFNVHLDPLAIMDNGNILLNTVSKIVYDGVGPQHGTVPSFNSFIEQAVEHINESVPAAPTVSQASAQVPTMTEQATQTPVIASAAFTVQGNPAENVAAFEAYLAEADAKIVRSEINGDTEKFYDKDGNLVKTVVYYDENDKSNIFRIELKYETPQQNGVTNVVRGAAHIEVKVSQSVVETFEGTKTFDRGYKEFDISGNINREVYASDGAYDRIPDTYEIRYKDGKPVSAKQEIYARDGSQVKTVIDYEKGTKLIQIADKNMYVYEVSETGINDEPEFITKQDVIRRSADAWAGFPSMKQIVSSDAFDCVSTQIIVETLRKQPDICQKIIDLKNPDGTPRFTTEEAAALIWYCHNFLDTPRLMKFITTPYPDGTNRPVHMIWRAYVDSNEFADVGK